MIGNTVQPRAENGHRDTGHSKIDGDVQLSRKFTV